MVCLPYVFSRCMVYGNTEHSGYDMTTVSGRESSQEKQRVNTYMHGSP